ncbi:MAG TPA: ABC transporter ATP-binding protein, partial [Candidatus Udaeobacter sp.]|nr:ABC transporter ATP-binding protein [Candidatus Udaeobacter sp.]
APAQPGGADPSALPAPAAPTPPSAHPEKRPSANPFAKLSDWRPIQDVRARVRSYLFPPEPMSALRRVCLAILVLFFLKGLFGYIEQISMFRLEQLVIRDLRNRLFAHITTLSLDFFHRRRTGTLISRLTNDVAVVKGAISAGAFIATRELLLLIANLCWVFWVSVPLAIVSLLVVPPSALLIVALGRKLRRSSRRTQERMAELTAALYETLGGMRVVKAFAMEEHEIQRFRAVAQRTFQAFVRLRRYFALSSPLSEWLGAAAAVAVLAYGGHLILVEHSLTPDRFLVFLVAMLSMTRPLRRLASLNADIQDGLAGAERLFEVLAIQPTVAEIADPRPITSLARGIRFEHVTFAYEPGRPVVEDISLEIRAGEVVALVGPSGSGKSTLADLLLRFYDPTAGAITLDGFDLRNYRLGDVRRLMGLVTQDVILFNDTVRANIAYGDPQATEQAIEAAARAAHAHDFIRELSQGYATEIGDRGVRLSGGQRQRLAIARAILKSPSILVLDEATSALDSESERAVQLAIDELMVGRTALVIAHRLSTVRKADRIVVLDRGRIVEEGNHAELLRRNGLYARLCLLDGTAEPVLAPDARGGDIPELAS